MSITITNITGLRNRGVEALVVPTIEQLHLRHPNLEIDILTKTPDYDERRLNHFNYVNLIDERTGRPRNQTRRDRLQSFLTKVSPLQTVPSEQPLGLRKLCEASAVIASGGDLFTSDYGFLNYHLQPLKLALSANVPVVFLAQSIGPFKTDQEAEAWLSVAHDASLVSVREPLSYRYVTQDLGLSKERVVQTADPAFLLKPASPEIVQSLLRYYGISQERPVVAIGASQGISSFGKIDAQHHLDIWVKVVKLLVDELGVQVLLIPHVQEIKSHLDDQIIANQLLRRLDFDPNVRLASLEHTASEFKGLIGACDMVIAERMHVAIAGLSTATCPLAIGYSVKAEGIMTDMLGSRSLHQDLLISIQEFMDADAALSIVRNAWNQRQIVSDELQSVLPQVKEKAAANYDLIAKIVNSKVEKHVA